MIYENVEIFGSHKVITNVVRIYRGGKLVDQFTKKVWHITKKSGTYAPNICVYKTPPPYDVGGERHKVASWNLTNAEIKTFYKAFLEYRMLI